MTEQEFALANLHGRLTPASIGMGQAQRAGYGLYGPPRGISDYQAELEAGLDDFVKARIARINQLEAIGDAFWLHVDLTIGAVAPVAGTRVTFNVPGIPFDVLLKGAHSNLRLSRIEVSDQSRTKSMMNAPVLLSAFATFTPTAGVFTMDRALWGEGSRFFLPTNSQLLVIITCDGTETTGFLDFLGKQPPTYYS